MANKFDSFNKASKKERVQNIAKGAGIATAVGLGGTALYKALNKPEKVEEVAKKVTGPITADEVKLGKEVIATGNANVANINESVAESIESAKDSFANQSLGTAAAAFLVSGLIANAIANKRHKDDMSEIYTPSAEAQINRLVSEVKGKNFAVTATTSKVHNGYTLSHDPSVGSDPSSYMSNLASKYDSVSDKYYANAESYDNATYKLSGAHYKGKITDITGKGGSDTDIQYRAIADSKSNSDLNKLLGDAYNGLENEANKYSEGYVTQIKDGKVTLTPESTYKPSSQIAKETADAKAAAESAYKENVSAELDNLLNSNAEMPNVPNPPVEGVTEQLGDLVGSGSLVEEGLIAAAAGIALNSHYKNKEKKARMNFSEIGDLNNKLTYLASLDYGEGPMKDFSIFSGMAKVGVKAAKSASKDGFKPITTGDRIKALFSGKKREELTSRVLDNAGAITGSFFKKFKDGVNSSESLSSSFKENVNKFVDTAGAGVDAATETVKDLIDKGGGKGIVKTIAGAGAAATVGKKAYDAVTGKNRDKEREGA